MAFDIYVTYSDIDVKKRIGDSDLKGSPFLHLIDSLSKRGKKEAYLLKSQYGARLDPFVLITDKDNPIKAFYSEASDDVIFDLINYINNGN